MTTGTRDRVLLLEPMSLRHRGVAAGLGGIAAMAAILSMLAFGVATASSLTFAVVCGGLAAIGFVLALAGPSRCLEVDARNGALVETIEAAGRVVRRRAIGAGDLRGVATTGDPDTGSWDVTLLSRDGHPIHVAAMAERSDAEAFAERLARRLGVSTVA